VHKFSIEKIVEEGLLGSSKKSLPQNKIRKTFARPTSLQSLNATTAIGLNNLLVHVPLRLLPMGHFA